jgi:putative ATP-binding cassette transporter
MLKSKLISTLNSKSPRTSRNLALLAAAAGLFQALVVVVINTASETIESGLDFRLLLMCFVCIGAFVVTKRMTLCGSARYAYDIVYEMRLRLVGKIRDAGLKGFEDLGEARLLSDLNQNSEIIIEAIKAVSHASSAAVMLFFSFIYIYFLSLTAFIMTGVLLLAGSYHYLNTSKKIGPQLREAKEIDSRFHGFLLQLINGFKELKVNRAKAETSITTPSKATHWRPKKPAARRKSSISTTTFLCRYSFWC